MTRTKYSDELGEQVVREILEKERTIASVAASYDLVPQTVGVWVAKRRRKDAEAQDPGNAGTIIRTADAALGIVVLAQVGSHDLDRDGPLEAPVTCPVDRGHAAPREFRENFVAIVQHASDHRVVGTALVHRGLLGKVGDLGWAMGSASNECRPIPGRGSSGRAA